MVNKITAEDLINKGVIGLPDVPGLTTIEMQKKLDEISIDVIIPRFNELIDNTVSASDEFSKLNTYNVGDYCIYQSVLYKCTTAITTAGEWDSTKWEATSIDKELKEISSSTENKDVISDKYDSSRTYSVCDYCIYDDTLYKCKTEITSAEEFDSSKWEATNCGKEFEVLNSNLSHYNPETDAYDIYYNGTLVGSIPCGFQTLVLYNAGVTPTGVTINNNGTGVTINSDNIQLKGGYSHGGAADGNAMFTKLIKLDSKSKISVECNISAVGYDGRFYIGLATSDSASLSELAHSKYFSNYATGLTTGAKTLEMDVSAITGNFYVCVGILSTVYNNDALVATVSNVTVE